ncbi:MAG TPA: hypothetical protein VG603_02830, partial [Chitinophagales bacterium]|nr:hypothetical protein [Chitinophagales bacterium]
KMIFARPGWLPEYLGGFQSVKEVDKNTYHKYDADTNGLFKVYALIQFFIMLGGSMLYMVHFKDMSLFYKVVFFLLILITMLITGAIFENKRWIVYAEYLRLVLVMVSLNTFYYFWYLNWFTFTIIVSSVAFAGCIILFTYSFLHLQAEQKAATVPATGKEAPGQKI